MTDPEDLISTAEAALILGISERSLQRYARDNKVPHVMKIPTTTGAYLFDRNVIRGIATKATTAA